MANSLILENVSLEDLKGIITNSVEAAMSKAPQPVQKSDEPESPVPEREARAFLGKSRSGLYSLRKKGKIKAHILGGRVYYFKSELIAAMK
jgi:hypothetical protein